MLTRSGPAATYTVQGVPVDVPMHVEEALGGLAVIAGDPDATAACLPADLEVARLPGGRVPVLLLCVRYVDNPLGAYDEVVVGVAARPRGRTGLVTVADLLRGRAGVWIDRMAVDQPFTREAGEQIWGYPKTLDELDVRTTDTTWTTTWARDGRTIAEVRVRRGGALRLPPLALHTYTQLEGRTVATRLTARGAGVGLRPGGVDVVLGSHPEARHLQDLGLDRRALASAWLGSTRMRFSVARRLDAP